MSLLTDNAQRDKVTAHGLGRDLALVDSGVPLLGPLDLQRPVVGVFVMRRLEALVRGVRVAAHRQDVNVPVPYPGDLFGQMSPPEGCCCWGPIPVR